MLITHFFSNTIGDATGTVTVPNLSGGTTSVAATQLPRPSDWNSVHALAFTITGNTTNQSTYSGSGVTLSAQGGVVMGFSNSNLIIGAPLLSSYVPYWPASTSTQTLGAMGTSTASAFVFPVVLDDAIAFNAMKLPFSASFVSSTVSGQQTITSNFGLFSNNAGTLSLISSNSFSIAMTVSSVSATISLPTATGTTGYGYGTVSASTTANAQSLFGTAGNRVADLQFGNSMSLPAGLYWVGLHQRQSTSSAAVGLSTGLIGNAMNATSGMAPLGSNTANFTNSSAYHFGAHGVYTSTGSAGYSGTALPSSMLLSGFNNSINVMAMVTFMST